METGHWTIHGTMPADAFGFIYEITNTVNQKKYIGKKQMVKRIKRAPLKGKKRKRIDFVESDWKSYTGSSDRLNADIEEFGKNAFTFTAGLFRLICSNGLVVADQKFEDVKMRHMGYTFEDLQVQIKEMVERLPLTVESMNKMKAVKLNTKQMESLAKKSLTTRFTKEQLKVVNINLKELLNPVRDEDKGDDLWSVFNVIQEKIIDGDFTYISGDRARKARQVKNFKQDMDINKKLFAIASELVPEEIAS